jgi:acid phosphatase
VIVVEENHSPLEVVGNPTAPYLNSLAQNGALLTNAHGNFRPSQPNYLGLFAGSNYGVATNDVVDLGARPNLGNQLLTAGRTFVGYSEGLPAVGSKVASSGAYARKHNPWADFSNVPGSSNRPFTDFPGDFTRLPTVSFVVPNLNNDSHDGTVAQSDTWLRDHLGAYATWARSHNSLLVVTYDEGSLADATNGVPTIFYGAGVKTGRYANAVTHYNVLRTVEAMYALPALNNAASAAPVDYVWNTTLAAPTNLAARASGAVANAIDLTWADNATNETAYKTERSTDGTTFYPLAATGANATTYRNTGLATGKRYYFRVYAASATARSANSNAASAVATSTTQPPLPIASAPAAPSNLSVAPTSGVAYALDLHWTDNATNETNYKIERSTDGITFYPLAATGANVTVNRNTGLTAGKRYYYRVYAINAAGRSGYSNVASAVVPQPATAAPVLAPAFAPPSVPADDPVWT